MYNSTQITILILLIIGSIVALSFIFFTRQTKNFFIRILPKYKKRYVVCHLRYQAGFWDYYNVIPNSAGLTQVGKYSYELIDRHIAFESAKRKHFILDEENAVPRTFETIKNEDITFQASVIQSALDNNVMEYLFSKKKEVIILAIAMVFIINIALIVYVIYELKSIESFIEIIKNSPKFN